MKAVRIHEFGGPADLKIEEVPEPKIGPGDVLIQMEAAGVNYADVMMRAGFYPITGLPFRLAEVGRAHDHLSQRRTRGKGLLTPY